MVVVYIKSILAFTLADGTDPALKSHQFFKLFNREIVSRFYSGGVSGV